MMMAINRTRGTAIGRALFVSLLISGNSVLTVEANCLTDKYTEIIRSDTAEMCQTYTVKKGMNYSLHGYYMHKVKDLSVGNVVMNEEKIFNLKKLDQIAHLEDGWNGNTAKAFEKQLISMVRRIITALDVQPELFPTACDSVQFEYEKEDGAYLEIEINSEDTWEVFEVGSDGQEKYSSIEANVEAIAKVVNSFYG